MSTIKTTQTLLTTSLCLQCRPKPPTIKTYYALDHSNTPNHLSIPSMWAVPTHDHPNTPDHLPMPSLWTKTTHDKDQLRSQPLQHPKPPPYTFSLAHTHQDRPNTSDHPNTPNHLPKPSLWAKTTHNKDQSRLSWRQLLITASTLQPRLHPISLGDTAIQ